MLRSAALPEAAAPIARDCRHRTSTTAAATTPSILFQLRADTPHHLCSDLHEAGILRLYPPGGAGQLGGDRCDGKENPAAPAAAAARGGRTAGARRCRLPAPRWAPAGYIFW